MRYSCNAPLNASTWPNSLATLRASLLGGEWQRDGIGARKWLRAPAWRLRTTAASQVGTGNPPPVGHIGSGSEQRPGLNLAALSYPIQRPTKTPPGLVRAAVTGFTDPGGGLGGSAHIQGSALATFSTAHTFDHNAFQTESPTERPLPAHQRTERGQKSSCEKAPWGGNQTDRRAFWARVGGIPITPTAGRA
jgi:hypothetical protein